MIAVVRYQLELLLRSQRWLPPFLAYVLLLGVGFTAGESLLTAYGYSTAVLLPVTAWYVRCTVTGEGAASRACLAAAVGRPRLHLATVVTAGLVGAALGLAGFLVVWGFGGPTTVPRVHPAAPLGPVLAAALLATAVCVLLGLAIGVLAVRPVLLQAQYGIPLSLVAAVLVLALPGSPANATTHALITAAYTGRVRLPLLALAETVLLAGAVVAGTAWLADRRTESTD